MHEYKKITYLKNENLQLKQEKEDKEFHLKIIEKTLLLLYNHLSTYEAHYYAIIFDDFSRTEDIPWEVYPALIRIESNFNPSTTSDSECKGLTQLKEKTAKEVATKLGISYTDATPWNDILNMVIGFTYFGDGFKEKKDSLGINNALKHAMKRYCGGPYYQKIKNDNKTYIKEYKSTVWQEYLRLSYVSKGVAYEDTAKKIKKPVNLNPIPEFFKTIF
jgi:hypothetical protein